MANKRSPGALVLDRLRTRIRSGRFFRSWSAQDRLPSIREIASLEGVDRKTAAAAYRQLQREGLVTVEPRSGVYLNSRYRAAPAHPLERVQRQWLEQTFGAAREAGLPTREVVRLVEAVAEVEALRVPVIECDWRQAESLASDLRETLHLHAMPISMAEAERDDPLLAEAPILITTPFHVSDVAGLKPGVPIVELTLKDELHDALQRASGGRVVVVVESPKLASKLEQAAALGFLPAAGHVRVVLAAEAAPEGPGGADLLILWPDVSPDVERVLTGAGAVRRLRGLVSESSVAAVQSALVTAAWERAEPRLERRGRSREPGLSTSSGGESARTTADSPH